ncbi:MAG: DipZ protein [Parcubacteria bacterium C7867-008]|nr:MAG: DipZ protein [Parcubacteria bacterium C7867-008]
MTLLFISFIAGLLTVLAPCILPLLPVVVGSSAAGRSRLTPFVVVGSLAVSVILFTYLLKVSTAFITIPPYVWTVISGGVLVFFGLTLVFPALWEKIPGVAKLSIEGNKLAGKGYQKKSFAGDILIGAALGPVFSSCSPTYFVILASVLPASFALGSLYLLAYVVGLSISLLAIAMLGQRFADKLTGVADPKSWIKRSIGILFIVLGVLIISGLEKKIEAGILTGGFFDVTKVEQYLLQSSDGMGMANNGLSIGMLTETEKAMRYQKEPELVTPDAYLNTNGEAINLAQYKGKNVVLLDFWTYSCINCQRTLPYITKWYGKYKDQGLVIIGVHTPEFAFEHKQENVQKALKEFGIEYPVVLDNEYKTWNAFGNRFWPHKYLIDIDGYIVYDHAGEGEYDVTEKAIQAALAERATRLGESTDGIRSDTVSIDTQDSEARSPETYFGSARNQYLGNGAPKKQGIQTLTFPKSLVLNTLYLQGTWNFSSEYATAANEARIRYTYNAKDIYFVASAAQPVTITVLRDGEPVGRFAGSDVDPKTSTVTVSRDGLYKLIHDDSAGVHTIELIIKGDGLNAFTFTFG